MSKAARIRAKVKNDEALNLTELSFVTGYDRGTLGSMLLPLVAGKIFYTDFRRIVAARQDRHEHSLASITPLLQPSIITPSASAKPAAASSPGVDDPPPSLADKFHAPKSTRVRPAASHARAGSGPRSTELQRRHA
jgi:hypothetical protein